MAEIPSPEAQRVTGEKAALKACKSGLPDRDLGLAGSTVTVMSLGCSWVLVPKTPFKAS